MGQVYVRASKRAKAHTRTTKGRARALQGKIYQKLKATNPFVNTISTTAPVRYTKRYKSLMRRLRSVSRYA